MSVKEITEALTSGDVVLSSFTVVEGSSLKQIADVVAENTKVTADEFLWQAYKNNYVSDYDFLSGIPDGQYNSLEGYLYPDTYYVDPENVSADTIIREMLDRFAEVEQELQLEQKASTLNLSLHELVTVASLIEDEAKIESERPVIAQVVYNRLAENMPLQFCSSVIYAWGGDLTEVLNEHLEIDSPYNTYINTGLPPGPISSPGYNSLNAAANPDTSCDYLFFVANDVTGDGSHVFARTFEEHEKNIAQYQR